MAGFYGLLWCRSSWSLVRDNSSENFFLKDVKACEVVNAWSLYAEYQSSALCFAKYFVVVRCMQIFKNLSNLQKCSGHRSFLFKPLFKPANLETRDVCEGGFLSSCVTHKMKMAASHFGVILWIRMWITMDDCWQVWCAVQGGTNTHVPSDLASLAFVRYTLKSRIYFTASGAMMWCTQSFHPLIVHLLHQVVFPAAQELLFIQLAGAFIL